MAIVILGTTKCAICERVIADTSCIVATQHFIADQRNPLWRYSDAAMHSGCFKEWPHRAEFVSLYNATVGQVVRGNGTRHFMREDGVIEAVVGREAQQAVAADRPKTGAG